MLNPSPPFVLDLDLSIMGEEPDVIPDTQTSYLALVRADGKPVDTIDVAPPTSVELTSISPVGLSALKKLDLTRGTESAPSVRNLAVGIPTVGYIPLGKRRDGGSVVWSHGLEMVMEVGPRDLFQPSLLTTICGAGWLTETYPKRDKDGVVIGSNAVWAGNAMDDACKAAGKYALKNSVGCGVWRDGDDHIVNSSEIFYASDYAPAARFTEDRVFLATHDLGIRPGQSPATKAECRDVLELLKTFNWRNGESEALRVLGWLATAYFPGALRKRTHIFISSKREGAGKSSIAELMELLLGGAAMSFSGPTEAGMRQTLQEICVAVIVDESGADSKAEDLADNIRFLRVAYDGRNKPKGTPGLQQAKNFDVRTSAMLLGVEFPIGEAQGQDNSRFSVCHLLPFETCKVNGKLVKADAPLHKLFPSPSTEKPLRTLGRRIFARMLQSLPRFHQAYDMLFQSIQASGRVSASIAPLLAGAFVMINDHEITKEEADSWVSRAKLDEEIERMSSIDPGTEFLDALLTTTVPSHILQPLGIKPMPFNAFFDLATFNTEPRGVYQTVLHDLGMHMRERTTEAVPGDSSHELCFRRPIQQNFKDLFKSHPTFATADLMQRIQAIEGMRKGMANVNFGTGAKNTLGIPYEQPERSTLRGVQGEVRGPLDETEK